MIYSIRSQRLRNILKILARGIRAAAIAAITINVALPGTASAAVDNQYIVLCYHSMPERYNGDPMAISVPNFAEQLSWLREQGYKAISMDDVINAKTGKIKLPAKSFMITVDDGYEDFYTNIFPILKLYKVPAVLAVVGRWTETGTPLENETDIYFKKQRFASWSHIKEMVDSGLVEIASHSYDLHHGILGNPQGNTEPAAVTLLYDKATGQYETLERRRARVRADLEKNSASIERKLGKRPRIMVWPYGEHDSIGIEEAARLGMRINFTLNEGLASASNTEIVPRALLDKEMPLTTFSALVEQLRQSSSSPTVRALKINLDNLYDANLEKQSQKLGKLIDGIRDLGINTVLLQPFVSPRHDGLIEEVYFPNSVLPMRGDLANRVAWQLLRRLNVSVYALIPASNYAVRENGRLRRLDVSDETDRAQLLKLYEDFGSHTPLRGLVFMDALTAPSQSDFNQEILDRISYYRPPYRPFYAGRMFVDPGISGEGKKNYNALDQRHQLVVIDAPINQRPDRIRDFIAKLPTKQGALLSLPVDNLTEEKLRLLIQKISFFRRHGLNNFLLDDDRFLDDPAAVSVLRLAVSLKDNPYVHVGQ